MIILRQKEYSKKKAKIKLRKNESISDVLDYDGKGNRAVFHNGELIKENQNRTPFYNRADEIAVDGAWNSANMRKKGSEAVVETNPFKKKILYIGNGSKSGTISNKSIEEAVKDHFKANGEVDLLKECRIIKDLKKGIIKRRINQGLVVAIPTATAIVGIKAYKKHKKDKKK